MREVNFSIPNVNKAAVHITTTLYDRRALDCTSTLPLINSLNHLAYLTTSSARIRDILTVDGGVERLVCMLKEGRSKDVMDMWKWNLAFQCVVNIGVRGSEMVRTRVVEADMVPVIATILGNYIEVVERQKAKVDADQARHAAKTASAPKSVKSPRDSVRDHSSRPSFFSRIEGTSEYRQTRRQAPPPSLDIPQPFSQSQQATEDSIAEPPVSVQALATSPPDRAIFARPQLNHHNRSHDGRTHLQRISMLPPLATAVPSMDTADGFSLRPVRDIDRLPSMLPALQTGLHTGITSNPDSPTTPSAPPGQRGILSPVGRRFRRPSIRHQLSTSGESDEANVDEPIPMEDVTQANDENVLVNVQRRTQLQAAAQGADGMDTGSMPLSLTIPPPPEPMDADTFNITHRTRVEGSILNANTTPVNMATIFSPIGPPQQGNGTSPALPVNAYPTYLRSGTVSTVAHAAMPRDEDVLMSLQLLAYVSKYCDLRRYFQATHLVPRLKIDRELRMLDATSPSSAMPLEEDEDEMEEFLQPDDFNIFPLVEKFTVRHHSKDMQYWACVVMRNLCRKDDSKGGIRQCAYYECGKWEEFTRQFAKCRRCRRTKYCSKECQRNGWTMHRHWCHTPPPGP